MGERAKSDWFTVSYLKEMIWTNKIVLAIWKKKNSKSTKDLKVFLGSSLVDSKHIGSVNLDVLSQSKVIIKFKSRDLSMFIFVSGLPKFVQSLGLVLIQIIVKGLFRIQLEWGIVGSIKLVLAKVLAVHVDSYWHMVLWQGIKNWSILPGAVSIDRYHYSIVSVHPV